MQVNNTFTNEKKRVPTHLKPTKSSINRAKSGYMLRKDSTPGNTFASAAQSRLPQEPTVTPMIKFAKQIIGDKPGQVTMPNNLNHLVSPSFAQKKNNIFRQERAAPEKLKSRNTSKTGLGNATAAAHSSKTSHFEGTFSR